MKLGTVDVKRLSAGGVLAREARLGTQQVYSIFKDPVSALFFRRQTAGGSVTSPALPQYGKALLSTIKGNSMVWNQLVNPSTAEASKTENGITFTKNGDGSITVSGTATAQVTYLVGNYTLVSGRKYLLSGCPVGGGAGTYMLYLSDAGIAVSDYGGGVIATAVQTSPTRIRIVVPSGATVTNAILFYPQLHDLTLLFNGAVPAGYTVADFERDYPLKYYDYNPGQIINLTGQGLETVGFNQWDEEWENGILDDTTGEPIPFSNRWRTKNFIPCLPGTAYYFHNGGSGALYVFEYDSAQNCIKYTTVSNAALTTQAGTHFLKFYVAGYGATYNHDICINISNATKNGTYEPYWKETKNLGLDSFDVLDGQGNTITIHGLAKAGSVYDEIDLARQKYIKRVGVVDLSQLTWTSPSANRWAGVPPSDLKAITDSQTTPNWTCSTKIPLNSSYDLSTRQDGICYFMGTLYCYKGDNNTPTGILNYELATPEEYDLETPMDAEYRMDYLGTEALIPENSSTPSTAAFSAEIKYPK